MVWILILAFALSSSLDNLGVGLSYGVRKIKISPLSNFIVALVCFLFSFAGIIFGQWLSKSLPGVSPIMVGSFLQIIIGMRIVFIAMIHKEKDSHHNCNNSIDDILEYSEKADFDNSGNINMIEAVFLGVALSVNALTNGLSAGLFDLSPFFISLTAAVGSFITVWLGVIIGRKLADVHIGKFSMGQLGAILSGFILIVIAISMLFQ